MSMLQQILQDMYVEPELLAELDDEQKQILFCKMREEQLKRWAANDTNEIEPKKQKGKKKIQWLAGTDGEPWVWVMGEHPEDKSIEEILEEEQQSIAHKLAEKEGEKLRKEQEESLKNELKSEEHASSSGSDDLENSGAFDNVPTSSNSDSRQNEIADLMSKLRSEPAVEIGEKTINGTNHISADEQLLIKEKEDLEKRLQIEAERRIEEEKAKREVEIYQSLKEARERVNKEAEREELEERIYWQEQERRAREAEEQIRLMARKARDRHRQHELRTSTSLTVALEQKHHSPSLATNNNNNTQILKLPRPPKPKSRDAIVEWFMKEEFPKSTGLDPKTGLVAPWFHGIISREQSEEYLTNRSMGAYLVRVSERIWGYTLSYSLGNNTHKHFLIERIPQGYQFLGTNQIVHKSLWDLISYHETVPITAKGKEVLREPVGQSLSHPDHHELFKAVVARARNSL